MGHMQTDETLRVPSKAVPNPNRIMSTRARIQDPRFPGPRPLLTILDGPNQSHSEMIRSPLAIRIRLNPLEYGMLRFGHCILYFEPVVMGIAVFLCSADIVLSLTTENQNWECRALGVSILLVLLLSNYCRC